MLMDCINIERGREMLNLPPRFSIVNNCDGAMH